MTVDLRSDTVTRPTAAMRQAMAADDLDAAGLPSPHSTALLRLARERVSAELRALGAVLDRAPAPV